ncbi:hypothetical protein BCR41DRAFT_348665 [Lobosporangium transversale]|uniref:26S proteasome complex subunit SEM1 n=1 Tax=Lobosporangium transversale TaxID=64571 RepID=A0A1Y2GUZ7_9FUNG|nr:hypothetical protein BCR41DRAFT_348665 [Lobosporangium transversale]ORZ24879.1 hypothetical protein BCR41DRAFT_348665 [Lobosporangium transversale]|eukprot:XP_021883860.1 hypothetical protein BCR41DRAFT_348665 [Lobosporangium transversale]
MMAYGKLPKSDVFKYTIIFNNELNNIDWNEAEEEKDAHQWDDNWDDDDVEDDFSNQLRAELQKANAIQA